MKMIRPIVNISKIIDNYDAVIVGFRGVLTEGDSIKQDAVNALVNIRKAGKRIVLCTNSALRSTQIADFFVSYKVPLKVFDALVSAGEILHYKLKFPNQEFNSLGKKLFANRKQKALRHF